MTSTVRSIAHMDLDTFFVSVERLFNSKLIGKPVLVGGKLDRGVVASCSYEARTFGVHSAMPIKAALRLCPQAIVVSGSMEQYSRFSKQVTAIIESSVPLCEKVSIDEHYIDLTGVDTYYSSLELMQRLRHTITRETGLPISFGLSVNKTVAKIATGFAKPNGEKYVSGAEVANFMQPLPIGKIPMVGDKTQQKLHAMGIKTIGELRTLSLDVLEKSFGKMGYIIWQKAQGIDNSQVNPFHEAKSISTERTFNEDKTDVTYLKTMLSRMAEKLCFELRTKQKLASVVAVKIRYSNFDTHSLQRQVEYTSLDHHITPIANSLFEQLYRKGTPVRLIGIKVGGLINGEQQLDLFDSAAGMANLYKELDWIRKRYGLKSVQKGGGMENT
ncbi:MAG: DNA polymerase IV [Bacteroidales bacterium]|nr:DNA polymerase IV [Bacteroidales bacterium]MBN2747952.1 DNA polymerase IV [Bacteroidales bacterium]